MQVNPQTTLLCQMLDITDPFAVFCGKTTTENPDEISLDVESAGDEDNDSEGESQLSADENSQESENAEQSNSKSDDNLLDTPCADDSHIESSMNKTTSEEFPTFLHSMTANESVLDESLNTESAPVGERMNSSKTDQPTNRKRISQDDMESQSATEDRPTTANSSAHNTEAPSGNKKFKRRNVAMYSILTNQGTGEDGPSSE